MRAPAGAPDVLVVGAGPAGWAAAGACAAAGLRVVLLAPDVDAPWSATYAAWVDELEGTPAEHAVAHRYDHVTVAGPQGARRLSRSYALLDNGALAAALRGSAGAAGVTVRRGRAVGSAPHHHGVDVVTASGEVLGARVVVDASGGRPALVRARPVPGWQVAHGVVAAVDGPLVVPGGCVLMDWTPAPGADGPPSFLYALDLGGGRALVEETVLSAAVPPSGAELADRLARRLAARGVRTGEVERAEAVRIPMGLAAPRPQHVVGFGAAAGLVHPATGYSVAASLRSAPRLAGALAAAVRRDATPAALASAGWSAVWPPDRRRARALELFGHDAIGAMDGPELGAFFDAFFALDEPDWSGYLAGTLPSSRVAGLMARLFAQVPWSLRRRLVRGDVRRLLAAVARA